MIDRRLQLDANPQATRILGAIREMDSQANQLGNFSQDVLQNRKIVSTKPLSHGIIFVKHLQRSRVCTNVARALHEMQDPLGMEKLQELAKSEVPEMRASSEWMLADIKKQTGDSD